MIRTNVSIEWPLSPHYICNLQRKGFIDRQYFFLINQYSASGTAAAAAAAVAAAAVAAEEEEEEELLTSKEFAGLFSDFFFYQIVCKQRVIHIQTCTYLVVCC